VIQFSVRMSRRSDLTGGGKNVFTEAMVRNAFSNIIYINFRTSHTTFFFFTFSPPLLSLSLSLSLSGPCLSRTLLFYAMHHFSAVQDARPQHNSDSNTVQHKPQQVKVRRSGKCGQISANTRWVILLFLLHGVRGRNKLIKLTE
jgi:hypothetical protein